MRRCFRSTVVHSRRDSEWRSIGFVSAKAKQLCRRSVRYNRALSLRFIGWHAAFDRSEYSPRFPSYVEYWARLNRKHDNKIVKISTGSSIFSNFTEFFNRFKWTLVSFPWLSDDQYHFHRRSVLVVNRLACENIIYIYVYDIHCSRLDFVTSILVTSVNCTWWMRLDLPVVYF